MTDEACCYCSTTEREVRPYGPEGRPVCYRCVTETPEREAAAAANFEVLLNAMVAISPVGLAILDDEGLRPYVPYEPKP